MANEQTTKQNTPANNDNSKLIDKGRTSGSQNSNIEKADASADISNIDQQEGNLNHGESGGGLQAEEDKK